MCLMKKLLMIVTMFSALISQAGAIHLSAGFSGTPFNKEEGSLSLGVKHFFFQDASSEYVGINALGLGLVSYKKNSVLASFTWFAIAPNPRWSFGVDIMAPIINHDAAPRGLLGFSVNFAL